jgi:hypothetical protein
MADPVAPVMDILKTKSQLVSWDDQFECYVWNSPRTLLSGITKRLKERFYARAPRPARLKLPKQPKAAGSKVYKKGKRGGTLVHEQLESFVESAQKGVILKDLDPRVNAIVKKAMQRGWMIYEAEYCVGDKELHLGTGVDLLCITEDGKIAVVEIKTGFDKVQYGGPMTMRMRKPFNMMDVSPWSQHQLQLLTTVGLFEKMTGLQVHFAEVWVVGCPTAEGTCAEPKEWPLHPTIVPLMGRMLVLVSSVPAPDKKRKYILAAVKAKNKKPRKS